jgi:hypothetical protein
VPGDVPTASTPTTKPTLGFAQSSTGGWQVDVSR